MPYSVMLWLVDPGGEEDTDAETERDPTRTPGAAAGFTAPPPVTCLSYGLFEQELDVEETLTVIAEALRQNAPLRVTHGKRTFLVPARRVHTVVCDEVTRPKDG